MRENISKSVFFKVNQIMHSDFILSKPFVNLALLYHEFPNIPKVSIHFLGLQMSINSGAFL